MMAYFRFALPFLFILGHFWSYGQLTENDVRNIAASSSEGDLLKKNNVFLIEGDIYFADIIADKLLSLQPENPNYNYRKGYSTFELTKNYELAIPLFQKAVSDVSNNYDLFSTREKSAPSDAYLYLAKCYHLDENLDEAEKYYQLFIKNSRAKSELLPQAELGLKQCAVARELMKNPVSIGLKNVGPMINTDKAEYSPVISLDGSALYFTSRRPWAKGEPENNHDLKYNQYGEDIYVSFMDFDMSWTEPVRLKFCKPNRNEASIAVSTDERRIHLYLDSQNNGDIFYSDFYNNRFNPVFPIAIEGVNTEYWEAHCFMSKDLKRFFFVSNRNGGYGGRDIYYCENLGNGEWSKPINMGPGINSAFDEDSPFVSFDNQSLYYSTNGPKSMGGFDIVKATLQEDVSWAESENLGYPFNSTNDDLYYTATVEGLVGYMTSYRKGGSGEKDIYEIQNEHLGIKNVGALKGTINNLKKEMLDENPQLSVNVICSNCDKNKNLIIYPRQRDGFFLSRLEPCKTYLVKYMDLKNNTVLQSDSFTISCSAEYQEITRELVFNKDGTLSIVEPVVAQTEIKDSVATLKFENYSFTHYFGYNKNILSAQEGKLKDFLNKLEKEVAAGGEKCTIHIFSSASKVPTQSFSSNEDLAKRRAESAQKMLNSYLASKPKLKDHIQVVISDSKVQGPDYQEDAGNTGKYAPFQYVRLELKQN